MCVCVSVCVCPQTCADLTCAHTICHMRRHVANESALMNWNLSVASQAFALFQEHVSILLFKHGGYLVRVCRCGPCFLLCVLCVSSYKSDCIGRQFVLIHIVHMAACRWNPMMGWCSLHLPSTPTLCDGRCSACSTCTPSTGELWLSVCMWKVHISEAFD